MQAVEDLPVLLLIDTAGCGMEERQEEDGDSKRNDGEAQVMYLLHLGWICCICQHLHATHITNMLHHHDTVQWLLHASCLAQDGYMYMQVVMFHVDRLLQAAIQAAQLVPSCRTIVKSVHLLCSAQGSYMNCR